MNLLNGGCASRINIRRGETRSIVLIIDGTQAIVKPSATCSVYGKSGGVLFDLEVGVSEIEHVLDGTMVAQYSVTATLDKGTSMELPLGTCSMAVWLEFDGGARECVGAVKLNVSEVW